MPKIIIDAIHASVYCCAMKTITVKYHNGKCRYAAFGGSASQVQQVLDLIHDEMVALAGNYKWSLDGSTGDYWISANYNHGQFVESTGKTPGAALRGCTAARTVLQCNYEGDWK